MDGVDDLRDLDDTMRSLALRGPGRVRHLVEPRAAWGGRKAPTETTARMLAGKTDVSEPRPLLGTVSATHRRPDPHACGAPATCTKGRQRYA